MILLRGRLLQVRSGGVPRATFSGETRPMPFLLLFALLLTACAHGGGAAQAAAPERISVTATPIPLNPQDASQTVVGRLRYLGGVQLTSTHPHNGALAGRRGQSGTLYAVSGSG